MLTVSAYAATSPTAPLTPTTIERRDLGPHDVLIEIKYAGICHSDIHAARGDWGPVTYPLVTGHEIAGIVTQVGPQVTKHAVGDRVGVGCMVDSCGECRYCQAGEEQFCVKGNIGTYGVIGKDGQLTQGATPPTSSSRRTSSCASPTASTSTSPPRCCAPASPPTRP